MFILKLVTLVFCIAQGTALLCLQCNNTAEPDLCRTVVTCQQNEQCVIEQIVTASGDIIYNTGCKNCAINPVFGRRDVDEVMCVSVRNSDIMTCRECCSNDLCNKAGCGTTASTVVDSGPFCYTCDNMASPSSCTEVTACKKDELCLIYAPTGSVFPVTYKTDCAIAAQCNALEFLHPGGPCPATCCQGDFCNNKCSTTLPSATSPIVMSTQVIMTTMPVIMTTIPDVLVCPTSYVSLPLQTGAICIRVYTNTKTWPEARTICQHDGSDLVVLDTKEKADIVKQHLKTTHHLTESFWIGAFDQHATDEYYWVNGQRVVYGDWYPGQPNHFDADRVQDCARMYNNHGEQWHDQSCQLQLEYICERT